MPIRYYPAIVEKGEFDYGVIFPDLMGCISAGDTVQDALLNAEEALSLHLESMARDGDPIPTPSPLENIPQPFFPEILEVTRAMVRGSWSGRSIHLDITLDENLLHEVDILSKRLGTSRSGVMAEAARRFIATT